MPDPNQAAGARNSPHLPTPTKRHDIDKHTDSPHTAQVLPLQLTRSKRSSGGFPSGLPSSGNGGNDTRHHRPMSAPPVTAHGRPESAGNGRRPGSATRPVSATGRPGSAGASSSQHCLASAKGGVSRPDSGKGSNKQRPDSAQLRPLKEHEEDSGSVDVVGALAYGGHDNDNDDDNDDDDDDDDAIDEDVGPSPPGSPMGDDELRIVEDDDEVREQQALPPWRTHTHVHTHVDETRCVEGCLLWPSFPRFSFIISALLPSFFPVFPLQESDVHIW